jgi:spermidine synthase
MTERDQQQAASLPASPLFLWMVLLLFMGSGCAALVYEIVWFQLLELVIGSSAVSLGLLLATFMGGMCLGSLGLPRVLSSRWHPLRVYACLELGIGVLGILVLPGIPWLGGLYANLAADGLTDFLLRAALCALCLLPPTLFMGATLPAIARWVETTPRGVSWLGFFYGGNTAGAVCGCLLAGFYLLRVYDMAVATYVAAAINLAVAVVAMGLASRIPYHPAATTSVRGKISPSAVRAESNLAVYVVIALSGMAALGAEVVWTRLLSLMLGGTTYTFSIILAVFLVGLGIGSSAAAAISRKLESPRLAFGVCQLLLIAAIAWTTFVLAHSLSFASLEPDLSVDPWRTFAGELAWCCPIILPAALLWGASFPLALAALATPQREAGRLVGGVYAANTIGAILGAIAFSLVFVPKLGTQNSQRLLIGISALAALLALLPFAWPFGKGGTSIRLTLSPARRGFALSLLLGWMVMAAFLAHRMAPIPFHWIAFGRQAPLAGNNVTELYRGEGMNATIAVAEQTGGVVSFHVSGKVEASTSKDDMRLQMMLAHLPAMLHPRPRSVLVVGFGAGVTSGAFLRYLEVPNAPELPRSRVLICEIEPLIPEMVSKHFAEQNFDVLLEEHVEVKVVIDDARHFIRTTREKFDIITSDPIHPWVKGAATLYTQEYFEQVRDHLNPGGIVTQWVPLYESNSAAVRSEIATFFKVFPYGGVWSNTRHGKGYDVVLLGSVEPLIIDLDRIQHRMSKPDREIARGVLQHIGFDPPLALLATFAVQSSDLAPWLKDAQINRDSNLRLQYLAGMTPNALEYGNIHDEMLVYRKFPENLFVGSEEAKQKFKELIEQAGKSK